MDFFYPILMFMAIGCFAGFLSGALGIGGGSIRIPLLNITTGMPLINAFGVNLAVIPISSMIGAYSHQININFSKSRFIIIGGICGSLIGALLTGLFTPLFLAVLFVLTSILTILGIYIDRMWPELAKKLVDSSHGQRIFIIGPLLLNLITGMRGGSGGSLFPPFLRSVGFDIHEAIATSLFVTIFTSLSGVLVYWTRGNIDILPTLSVILGSVIGVRIGSLISLKAKPTWLEASLSIIIILLSCLTLFKAL